MRATMMDVAARAGVSQATVSLILNGSPGARFSEATRLRVREAASDLGYRLARHGDFPAPPDQRVIAFVADEVATDPWIAQAFEGARVKALESGLRLDLSVAPGAEAGVGGALSPIPPPILFGYVFATMLTRQIVPPPALFETPTILLNCYDRGRRLPSVLPGDTAGGRAAVEYLIRAGRRRIGFINGQDGIDASRDRLRGYRQALASKDIGFDPVLVRPGNWEPSSGYSETLALMGLADPPDAIFCGNDMMALGCLEALKEMGLRIPQDVAVVGFDNREIAQFTRPPLTTLRLPHHEMGILAVEQLVDRVGGLPVGHVQLKVECEIVERASV